MLTSMVKKFVWILAVVLISSMVAVPFVSAQTTLDFPCWWWGEDVPAKFLTWAVAEFEKKYPDIKVNGYDIPWGQYWDKMSARLGAGNPPDMIPLYEEQLGTWGMAGVLESLDKQIDQTDMRKELLEINSFPRVIKEKTYAVPWELYTYIPIYNDKMYKEAGIGNFPVTPEGFIDISKKLTIDKDNDGIPEQYGYAQMLLPTAPNQFYWDVIEWVVGSGGHFVAEGKPVASDRECIAGVQRFKRAYEAHVGPRGVEKSTYRKMWMEEKVACIWDGSFMFAWAEDANPDLVNHLKAAPPPFPEAGSISTVSAWAIPKDAKHKQAAWKWILFMVSEEVMSRIPEGLGNAPARAAALSESVRRKMPWMNVYIDQFVLNRARIVSPLMGVNTTEATKIIADYVQDVVFGGASAFEAMQMCQEDLEMLSAE